MIDAVINFWAQDLVDDLSKGYQVYVDNLGRIFKVSFKTVCWIGFKK